MTPVDRAESVFVGRSSEIARLHQAFEAVRSGLGPQLLVLQGESGVGKTRIIQEFFHVLSTRYDAAEPGGFWPDRLGRNDESLRVNPDFPRCDNDAVMPFLWTAIRFSDPGQRNSSSGAEFAGWRQQLGLLGLLLISSAKKERGLLQRGWADIKKSIRYAANDPGRLAESAFSQILGATGIPLADKVVPMIRTLFGIFESDGPGAEIRREIDARREATAEVELFRYVYDDLAATEIPTVMLVDDAQWADPDFALMLARLCDAAHHRRWPMLFVATCWPEPWHNAEAFVAKGGALPKDPSQYAKWITQPAAGLLAVLVSKRAELLEVKRLKPGADGNDPLALMLREAFPGMQDAHHRVLLDAAEGNPQHLLILIREIADCETWFQGKNTNNPLKTEVTYGDEDERMSAEEALRRLGKIQIVDLVRRQLQKAEEGVKAGVAFGSHIGISFPAELARRLAVAHGQAVDQQALMKAWRPHAFVETRGEAATHRIYEFAARVYHSAAQRILRNSFVSEEKEVDRTLGLVLKEWIENDDVWRGLPEELRAEALEIAIGREGCAEEIDPFRLLDRVDDRLRILREQNAFLSIGLLLELTEPVAQRALARLCEEERTWPVASRHRLMNVLVMRGGLADELSRPGLALAVLDKAIGLGRALLAALGEQAPPGMRNDLAGALMKRGLALSNLGRLDEAVASYDEVIGLRRALLAALGEQAPPGMRNDLAKALMNRGIALRSLSHLDEALAAYDEAIGLWRALLEALGEQAPPGMRNDLAAALTNRGNALSDLRRLDEAVASYDEAIGLRRALLAALGEQAPPGMRNDLAAALTNRGIALRSLSHLDEALAAHDEAIGLWRALLAALGEQAPPGMRNDLAKALTNRGNALFDLGRLDEALASYDEVIGLRRALLAALGEQAPPEMRNDLAMALTNRGNALFDLGRLDEAVAAHDEAIGLRRALLAALGEQAPPRMRNDLAAALTNRGNAIFSLLRLEEAAAAYDEAIGLRRALLAALGEQAPPEMRNDLAMALTNRGVALRSLSHLDEALAAHDEAIGLWRALLAALGEQAPPEMRNDLAMALTNRGNALFDLGRLDEAVAAHDEAIGLWRALLAALGEQAPPRMRNDLAAALTNRGNALSDLGRLDEALASCDEAIGLWRALLAALGEQAPPGMRKDFERALLIRGGWQTQLGQ